MYPTKDETKVWVALNLSQRGIYRGMDSALKAEGLPPLRWYDVLWELERAKEGELRPRELEKSLIFEQSNLSRLLRRMVGEGFVDEATFKEDRRGKVLRITEEGRQVRARMWKVYGPLIHRHISRITDGYDLKFTASALNSLIG
jgi:DNA-binding MarR family transcriptional regulator